MQYQKQYQKQNLKFDLENYIKKFKIDQNNIFSNKIKKNIRNLLDEYKNNTILTTLTDIKDDNRGSYNVDNDKEEYILKTFTETYEYGKLWKNIGKVIPVSNNIDITYVDADATIKKKIVNRESLTDSEYGVLKSIKDEIDASDYILLKLDEYGNYSPSGTAHYFVPDDKIKFGKKWELYDGIPEPNIQIKYDDEELGKKLYNKIMANKGKNSDSNTDKIYRVELKDEDIPLNLKIYNYIEYKITDKKYYFIPLNNDILNNLLLDIRFNKDYKNVFKLISTTDLNDVTTQFIEIIKELNNKKERIDLSDFDLDELKKSDSYYKNVNNCTTENLVKMRYIALMLYIKKLFNNESNIFDLTSIKSEFNSQAIIKDIIKDIYFKKDPSCGSQITNFNYKEYNITHDESGNINPPVYDRNNVEKKLFTDNFIIYKDDIITFTNTSPDVNFKLVNYLQDSQVTTGSDVEINSESTDSEVKNSYKFLKSSETDSNSKYKYKDDSGTVSMSIDVMSYKLDNLNELAIYFYLKETLLKLHNNIYLELNKFIENNGNLIDFSKDIKEVIEVLNFIKILIFLTIIYILKNGKIKKDLNSILSNELDKIYLNVMNSHSISDIKIDDSISKINDIDDKKKKTNENIKSLKKNEERIKNLKNKQYYEIGIVVLLIVIIMILLLNFNLDNSKKVNIKYLLCLSIILLIIVYNFDKNYIENFATKDEQFNYIQKYIKNINLTNVIGINEKVIKDDFDQVVKSDLIGINSDFLKIKGNEISINESYNKLNREKRVTKYSIYLVIYLLIVILLLNVLLVELNLDKKILYVLGIILLIMGICLYIYMVTSIRERDSFKYYFPI